MVVLQEQEEINSLFHWKDSINHRKLLAVLHKTIQ